MAAKHTRAEPAPIKPMPEASIQSLVTLIRPPVLVARWAHTTPTCPPIGLAYIAGAIEATGATVVVVDAVGEATDQFMPTDDERFLSHGMSIAQIVDAVPVDTDMIGVSCMFSHEWPLVRSLVEQIKLARPNAIIIAGGEHVTAMPDFTLEQCAAIDVGVIGEGEDTIADLVRAISNKNNLSDVSGIVYRNADGVPVVMPARPRMRAVDDIQPPSWPLFPLETYLENGYGFGVNRGRSMPVIATRGCPYQCTFCSNPAMWGTRWVARDVEVFFAEMMSYLETYKVTNFDFYDLTAIVKKKWIVEFCNLLIDHECNFTWQLPSGTRSEAIDEEVTALLYKSGCRNMSYAPESGSPEVLERIKKKIDLDKMLVSMRGAVKQGINCKANIMIGFPGETHSDVWKTMRFIVSMARIGLHDMSVSPFSPYPGSELFDDMRRAGRIPDLSDDYFYSLASYTDLTSTVSCSEHISNRALGFYRIFGMLLFYASLYIIRPWRLFRTIRNVFGSEQESRLEMSLRDLLIRLKKGGSKSAPVEVK